MGVLTFHKGDCEHCSRIFHYTLLHAGFGDYSYAYCDSCGALATIDYSCSMMTTLPPISVPHQVIDAAWEPYLRPCQCGGHFRRGAFPRCVHCNQPLSAEHAAIHVERNSVGAPRGWRWQRNWTDEYCIALEDPNQPGSLCQEHDPFFAPPEREKEEKPHRSRWSLISNIFS